MPQLLGRHFPIKIPTEKKSRSIKRCVASSLSFCPDYKGGLSVGGYFKTNNTKLIFFLVKLYCKFKKFGGSQSFATRFIEIQPLLPKYTILNTVLYKSAQYLNTLQKYHPRNQYEQGD